MLKQLLAFISVLLLLYGCSLTEYEVEGDSYTWNFASVLNDSVAVAEVIRYEYGTIHDDHWMSYTDGENFSREISRFYYPVGMKIKRLGKKETSLGELISIAEKDSVELPRWTDGCFVTDSIGGFFYCINAAKLDSNTCAIILVDSKNTDVDSLKIEDCSALDWFNSFSFVGDFLKIKNSGYGVYDFNLYKIGKNKFEDKIPTYKITENGSLTFVDLQGNTIVYEGDPE
ncbi:MAG: hypothetical protein WCX75_02315 [Fibrobacteraceae bacterium]